MSQEIENLQRDLAELGFKLVGFPIGEMNLQTESALREFQRYAKWTGVAQEDTLNPSPNYVDRLSSVLVPATHLYRGAIHGKADAATVSLIAHWKANKFRCPVVVQAWRMKKIQNELRPVELAAENLWLHNDLKNIIADKNIRIFARDFSDYYTIPPEYINPHNRMTVLGYYQPFGKFGGPNAIAPQHTRPVSEILPENLIGKPFEQLNLTEKSTYKVVRVISEIECEGFYDIINCYDNAFVSLGPCHWTLGILFPNTLEKGELGAYFAYLTSRDRPAFEKALGFWGIKPQDWGTNGAGLFDSSSRKYVSTIYQQKEDGTFEEVPRDEPHWNFFKSWHWFYRFQAACRSIEGFRRGMWDMTRIRLRDILETPWREGALPPAWGNKKLKDIFSSELAAAMLLRWHVFSPADVVNGGKSGADMAKIVQLAQIPPAAGSPDRWGECQQNQLIQGFFRQVQEKIKFFKAKEAAATTQSEKNKFKSEWQRYERLLDKLKEVEQFPVWTTPRKNKRGYVLNSSIGKLSRAKDSLKFHGEGLPAPPFNLDFESVEPLALETEDVSPADVLSEKLIVSAFIGNKEAFKAVSNGQTIFGRWLVEGAEKKKIDRLVFFEVNEDDAKALWALPVVINRNSGDDDHLKISVSNEGSPNAVLKLNGKFRCFCPMGGDESLELNLEINHQTDAAGQRRVFFKKLNLTVGEAKNFLLEELRNPNNPNIKDKLKRKNSGGFKMSDVGTKLGLNGTFIDQTYELEQKLEFKPNKFTEQSDLRFPELVMSIETQVGLANSGRPNQKLIPFDILFSWQETKSVVQSNGGGNIWHYLRITQRQPFGESWQKIREGETHWIFETDFPHRAALDLWNESVERPVRQSLHTVQDGRPVTFLPTFADANVRGKFWKAKFSVIDKDRTKDIKQDCVRFPSEEPEDDCSDREVIVFGRSMIPELKDGFRVEAALQGFSAMSGESVVFTTLIRRSDEEKETEVLRVEKDVPEGNKNPGFYFRLVQTLAPQIAGKTQAVRVGSLNLEFFPPSHEQGAPTESDEVENNLLLRAGFDNRYDKDHPPSVTLRSARYRLAMKSVAPGGQDAVPGEEFFTDLGDDIDATDEYRRRFARDLALIVNLNKNGTTPGVVNSPPLFLSIEERIEPRKSQTIALQIKSKVESKTVSEVIVIDPHPFLISKVSLDNFQKALSEGITNEIGNWTNRADVGAGWEISAGAEGFDLFLPPQTVGEAMHRSKDAGDITPEKPIDFRFSPPAKARIRPSFYRQRFAEVPWNLRRILGYVGQRAPGAGVDKIDFELFYGLSGQITYPYLRLAEIGSRLGANPGQQYRRLPWKHNDLQKNQYEKFRDLWKNIFPSLMSRLAILEPWDANQLKTLVLSEKDGLSFELRKEAKLRYPIRDVTVPPDGFNGIEFPADGLTGGYSWGFESNNVFQAVLRTPVSYAAQITRPLFSSLGGWGQQKALFDQGLTTISSETVMGRVSSINIERVGRISVFWNKAKHVIVYERTVVPSRQFFMEQEPLVGNPVLRKVDEYIELLEDDRPFPDYESFTKISRGCVLGCRFPSGKPPRIRVNSRWGQDIGEIGWKVPLWVRGAAPSDVYQKPDIRFMMAGKIEGSTVPVALDDPEKLYFFTLTAAGASRDTDNWAAIEGIDFEAIDNDFNKPLLKSIPNDPGDATREENLTKKEFPIVEGKGAFTFALAPAPAPVNVMVDRVAESITAQLQNVTVMRGFVPEASVSADAKSVLALRDKLGNGFSPILSTLPAEEKPLDSISFDSFGETAEAQIVAGTNLNRFIAEVRNGIDNTRNQFVSVHDKIKQLADNASIEPKIVEEIKQRFAQHLKFAEAQIPFEIETVLGNFKEHFLNLVEQVRTEFPTEITDEARMILKARLSEIADDVDEVSEFRKSLRAVRGTTGETLALLEKTITDLDKLSKLAGSKLENSKCEICRIENWGESKQAQVEKILNETRAEITEIIRQTDFLLAEIPRQWVGNRIDNIRTQLNITGGQALPNRVTLENTLRALYYKAFQLRSVSQADVPAVSQADVLAELEKIIKDISDFISRAQDLTDPWKRKLESFGNGGFEELLNGTDGLAKKIGTVLDQPIRDWNELKIKIAREAANYFSLLPEQIESKIRSLRESVGSQAEELRNLFLPNLEQLRLALEETLKSSLADDIKTELEKIKNSSGQIAATAAQLRAEVERLYSRTLENLNEYINRAAITIPLSNPMPFISKDNALRLIRGFGEPPRLPNLEFSLPALGYYPFDTKDLSLAKPLKELTEIGLTPVVAQANRILGDAANEARKLLNPLEIKLPTENLFDRFKPIDLKNFDLSKVFPNFAGLNLAGLFANLRMPDMSSDRVKVTHGINPETRSGWMNVKVDVPFEGQPITVFSLAGVTLRLLQARFVAEIKIEFAEGRPPKQTVNGSISGDWDLQVGGFPVAIFANCSLMFEEGGKIRFDISPDRVKLQQVLAFLSDLIKKFGYSDKGFSIAVTPSGIHSILDLPLPDVQAGAFGIANLNLGLLFGLEILDGFQIRTQLSVGRRDAPFTITIFILGGAGFFELDLFYKPTTKLLRTTVNIGIFAAASLAISAGPIKGGIYAYFGITVQYQASNQSAGRLTVGLLLLFRGEVRLLGIVTITLVLALEAQYTNGGGLVGRGRVSLEIKICWCVKIKVKAQIEYRFGNKAGGSRESSEMLLAEAAGEDLEAANPYQTAARNYISMFA